MQQSPRLDRQTFLQGLGKLITSYPTRVGSEDDAAGLTAAWWDVFSTKEWVTVAVWQAGVQDILETSPHMPSPAIALEHCRAMREELARDVLALPPPKIDRTSATPEERQRWAKEDVELRSYGSLLVAPSQEVLERMNYADREAAMDAHERNVSVANWVNLSPEQRRAKETRIALEKENVPALIDKARKETRARLDAITAARAQDAHPRQAGGVNTVAVKWSDGKQTVTLMATEENALRMRRWLQEHSGGTA